jgi:hypothetical protein
MLSYKLLYIFYPIFSELAKSEDKFFVDFVGEKSKNMKFTSKDVNVKKRPINPFRLFISGLPKGMTLEKLKLLFPKSVLAQIKSKGSQVGFVQFESAADAKSGKEGVDKKVYLVTVCTKNDRN